MSPWVPVDVRCVCWYFIKLQLVFVLVFLFFFLSCPCATCACANVFTVFLPSMWESHGPSAESFSRMPYDIYCTQQLLHQLPLRRHAAYNYDSFRLRKSALTQSNRIRSDLIRSNPIQCYYSGIRHPLIAKRRENTRRPRSTHAGGGESVLVIIRCFVARSGKVKVGIGG